MCLMALVRSRGRRILYWVPPSALTVFPKSPFQPRGAAGLKKNSGILFNSNFSNPINIGSEEKVSINQLI